MRFKIRHVTEYEYSERVNLCYNKALISPLDNNHQNTVFHNVYINPYPDTANFHQDYFGNTAYFFDIYKPHEKMIITAETEIEISERNSTPKEQISFQNALEFLQEENNEATLKAKEFLYAAMIKNDAAIFRDFAKGFFIADIELNEAVKNLTEKIYTEFTYDPDFSTVATPLADVIKHKRGVCQDFAHLQIACLRSMGIPAKYVSGYIETLPPEGQKKLRGVDATHAWIAYYLPNHGWIEYDPTNNKLVDEQYIVTAYGRDYFDVTPLKGVIYGGGKEPQLRVSVDVARIK